MKNKTNTVKKTQKDFYVPKALIEAYKRMAIFNEINPKGLRDQDIKMLHNLAYEIHKNHSGLSAETILLNQIELYIVMREEFQKFNRTKHTQEDKDKMREAVKRKQQELLNTPIINELYETDFNQLSDEVTRETKESGNTSDYRIVKNVNDAIFSKILSSEVKKGNLPSDKYTASEEFLTSAEKLDEIFNYKKEKTQQKSDKSKPTLDVSDNKEKTKPVKDYDNKQTEDTENKPEQPSPKQETPINLIVEELPHTEQQENNTQQTAETSQQPLQSSTEEKTDTPPVTETPANTGKEEEEDNNDDFKKTWREFANKVAQKLEGKMEEDVSSKNFEAKITAAETTTYVKATAKDRVAIGAQRSDGSPTIPEQKVFDELAIKSKDDGINFGNIQSPEFKARLMIACLKNDVKMTGQPKLDEAFLSSLDANGESAKYLKAWQNKTSLEQDQPQTTTDNKEIEKRIEADRQRLSPENKDKAAKPHQPEQIVINKKFINIEHDRKRA